MEPVSYTHLRKNLATILDKVVDDCQDYVVCRNNGKKVVLIDADELSSIRETAYLFGTKANTKELEEAMERAKRGEGTKIGNIRDYFGL